MNSESKLFLNKQDIEGLIPHRSPMLLADSAVVDLPGCSEGSESHSPSCETSLFIDPSWDIFKGHFPGSPVFPGVLTAEAMAQCADILLAAASDGIASCPLLSGIRSMHFVRKVLPGETLTCTARFTEDSPKPPAGEESAGMFEFRVRAEVSGSCVARGIITISPASAHLPEQELPSDPSLRRGSPA